MQHIVDDEDGYDRWIQEHPHGFVLNQKRARSFTVHIADCDHIAWFGPRAGTAGNWEYTKGTGKRCFADRQEALSWIVDNAAETTDCRDCAPGFAARRTWSRPAPRSTPTPRQAGVVRVGSGVLVEDEDGERVSYHIGPDHRGPAAGRSVSPESPIARALLGARAGQDVEVEAPGGSYSLSVQAVHDPSDQ